MENFQCECTELNLQSPTDYFGRFVFQPLKIGDGTTIGNALRRVLLSNLPCLKIVGVRIAGAKHEYTSLPGVRDDVLDVLLNLKDLILKGENPKKSFGRLKVQGPAIVTAANIEFEPGIDVLNPSQYIATLVTKTILEMEVKVAWGQGYTLAEDQPSEVNSSPDFFRLDPAFMPVHKVVCQTTPGLIEGLGRQEQLILDVWTNGSITPLDAITLGSKKLVNCFSLIEKIEQKSIQKEVFPKEKNVEDLPIEDLNLSARAYNALKAGHIDLIGDLLKYSLKDLKKIKNLGQKSVNEINNALEQGYALFLD